MPVHRLTVVLATAAAATIASHAGLVFAEPSAGIDLRTLRPSTDGHATLATEPIDTPGHFAIDAGMWLSFATTQLHLSPGLAGVGKASVVGPQLLLEPTFALGLGGRAALGATIPAVLIQGTGTAADGTTAGAMGIGDLTLTGKVTVIKPAADSLGGFGFALATRISLPTGDRKAFIGEDGSVAEMRAIASYDLAKVASVTGVFGYRTRFHPHVLADVTLGDTIPWGLSVSLRPYILKIEKEKHWTWTVEARGEVAAVPNKFLSDARLSPAFLGLSARYEFVSGIGMFFGAEKSLSDAIGAPSFRGIFALSYTPRVVDDDADGVPDDKDDCPGLPEDGKGKKPHDGCPDYDDEDKHSPPLLGEPEPTPPAPTTDVERTDKCSPAKIAVLMDGKDDGCPVPDSDLDTFADAEDKCPDNAENFNGLTDGDGCPEPGSASPALVQETVDGLTLSREIIFVGASVGNESEADLRAISAYLLAHPKVMALIAVRPGDDDDRELSKKRADTIAARVAQFAHQPGVGVVSMAVRWNPRVHGVRNVIVTFAAKP